MPLRTILRKIKEKKNEEKNEKNKSINNLENKNEKDEKDNENEKNKIENISENKIKDDKDDKNEIDNEDKNKIINEQDNKDKNEKENNTNKEEKEENESKKQQEQKEEDKEKKENNEKEENEKDKNEEKNEKDENSEKDDNKEKKEKKEDEFESYDNFATSINDTEEEKEVQEKEEEEEEEIINEKENEEIIYKELIDYLFKFLDDESSIQNQVLSGYFNKIINFLLKKNTKMMLTYFYKKKKNILNKLLYNIGQISIENIVENILNALAENIIPNSIKHFYNTLDFILDLISKEETNDNTVEAICQLLVNTIIYNNKLKFCSFIESSFIQKIKDGIQKLYENKEKEEKKIIYVIELVTKINNNILNNLEKRITPNSNLEAVKVEIINIIKVNDRNSYQYYTLNDNNKEDSECIFNTYKLYLQNYCESLNELCLIIINDIISDNNLGKDNTKFGINNLYKFDFICSVIDLYINNLSFEVYQRVFIIDKINELIKTKIFNKINSLFFIYNNNNFFANIYSQIIQIIVNENTPNELINNILLFEENNKDKNLINLLINDIINNLKYIFKDNKNEIYSLSFSNEVYILNSIFSSNNIYIQEIINKSPNEKFFYEMFIQNIMKQFNSKLYKINDNIEQKKVDLLNPYFDPQKEQSDTDIPFTLQSFSEVVSLYLLVYEKYTKNEDYKIILKENDELLEVSINYI